MRSAKRFAASATVVYLLAGTAQANTGVPMLIVVWPAHWLAFLPIVLVEAWFLARAVPGSYRARLGVTTQANLLSTVVGIPLTWVLLLFTQVLLAMILPIMKAAYGVESELAAYPFYPFLSAWILGTRSGELELAFLALAIPFCMSSIFVEHRFLRARFPAEQATAVCSAVRKGNVASYLLLCLPIAISLLI